VTKEEIYKEYETKSVTKKVTDKVLKLLRSEVEVYDQYLQSKVYGYEIVDKDGGTLDSCWGFYGDYEEYMVPEAKSIIDHRMKEAI
jgi:hypothetical protein